MLVLIAIYWPFCLGQIILYPSNCHACHYDNLNYCLSLCNTPPDTT